MKSTVNSKNIVKKSILIPMTASIWEIVRVMYETGDYTQQQLVDYVKSKGFKCHQSTIGRRIEKENWVKGSIREEARQQALVEIRKGMGERIVSMLEQHAKMSQMLQAEVLIHFKAINKRRENDPDIPIPASQLATLSTALKTSQDMQARSTGWDYKVGQPYSGNVNESMEQIPVLRVEVMTEEFEEEIRRQGEKELEEISS